MSGGAAVDVLVVGGGPAGLTTAIACRRRGLSVYVVDRAKPTLDKACGEGLMPDGLAILEDLGVPSGAVGGHPFHGIRYLEGDLLAEGRFPGPPGMGVRRTQLHDALVQRAEACGVEVRWGCRATGLRQTAHAVTLDLQGEPSLTGRWLVGADGLRSKVRQWADMGRVTVEGPRHRRFGIRRHYRLAPWSDCVDVHWADGREAYVTPVGPQTVGVAILWQGAPSGFDAQLKSFPRLAKRLDGAQAASRDRGSGPLQQPVRSVQRGRVALVGDASGYLDAITGEGLSLAFHQSVALAGALADGAPSRYRRAHRRIGRLPEAMIRLLLFVESRPRLRRRMIQALAREPAVFDRFLAVHSRDLAPYRLGIGTGSRLLWALARP